MNKDLFTATIMRLLEDAGVETGQGSERGLLTETAVNDIADAIFPFVAQELARARADALVCLTEEKDMGGVPLFSFDQCQWLRFRATALIEKAITRDTLPPGWVWCAPCECAYPPGSVHAAANDGDTN